MMLRAQRLKQYILDAEPTISSERAKLFTEALKAHEDDPASLGLAKAFAYVLDNITIRIEPDELIVGNMGPTPRSCQVFPEYSWTWICDELDRFDKRMTERFAISEEDRGVLREVFEYWRGKSIAEIANERMPLESIKASRLVSSQSVPQVLGLATSSLTTAMFSTRASRALLRRCAEKER